MVGRPLYLRDIAAGSRSKVALLSDSSIAKNSAQVREDAHCFSLRVSDPTEILGNERARWLHLVGERTDRLAGVRFQRGVTYV